MALGVALVCIGAAGAFIVDRPTEPTVAAASRRDVFVPVERGRLTSHVVTRGNVVLRHPVVLLAGVPAPDRDPVLTQVQPVGTTVVEGMVAFGLAGRPVIALSGAIPAYRDLALGDSGNDVADLQRSLARLRLYRGRVDGVYTADTAAAVAQLYASRGFAPPAAAPPEAGATPFVRREFVVLKTLPATVQAVSASVGQSLKPDTAVMTLSAEGALVEVPFLDEGFARFAGRKAEVFLDQGGPPVLGTVDGEGADAEGARTLLVSGPIPVGDVGKNVKVVLIVSEAPEETLLVPLAALVNGADGRAYVHKRDGAAMVPVEVSVLDESDGAAAIRPAADDDLRLGDQIRLRRP